jgi:guanylate kinase
MTIQPSNHHSGKFIILSSPSGGGKSTITRALLAGNPNLIQSISVTTRPARADEINGKSYWFVDRSEFLRKRDAGELLEWEDVYGQYYGTPRQFAEEAAAAGRDVIFVLDVKGALKMKTSRPEALLIFLYPPSLEILEQRLRNRGTETEVRIRQRLSLAHWECDQASRFDHTVLNGDLQETIQTVTTLINHYLLEDKIHEQ